MIKKTLSTIRGIITVALLLMNALFVPTLVIIVALISLIIPIKRVKRATTHFCQGIAMSIFSHLNRTILKLTGTKWEVNSKGTLKKDDWYFLMSNHQSWLDILVLQITFNRKIPMLKFFFKQELLWTLPMIGVACYLLDFPLMKRHSKEFLRKHPGQRDKDMQTTKKKCEKFKHIPTTITSFSEGTRFTEKKRRARKSAYENLLPPKASGMAFALEAMGGTINKIIDTTIIYEKSQSNFWDFLCGRLNKLTIDYEIIPIPDEIVGDYYHDRDFRRQFQQWLNGRWEKKDKKISELK